MALRGSRYRTATGIGTFVAFLLVLIFGSPWYVDWANKGNRGLLLETLKWPAWSFSSNQTFRSLLASDLKAILLIAFTALFIILMLGAELSRARSSFAAFLTGWACFIFAAALAALLTAFIDSGAGLDRAIDAAGDGAHYGLIVGWIIGLATLGARRP